MQSISVHELSQHFKSYLLIDVREPWEWDTAHIDGAVHIPSKDLLNKISMLDCGQSIAVICHHGVRSARAAELLLQHGLAAVYNVIGGVDAWSKEIDPSVPLY